MRNIYKYIKCKPSINIFIYEPVSKGLDYAKYEQNQGVLVTILFANGDHSRWPVEMLLHHWTSGFKPTKHDRTNAVI